MNQKLLLVLILLLGSGLRIAGLSSKSLWYDEAVSASSLHFTFDEILERKGDRTSVHPPLYFLALKGWAELLGTSEAAIRSLAVVFGILTILGMGAFGRELGRLCGSPESQAAAVGLWVAFLTAMHPLHILSSQQVRGYSMGTALFAFANWALVRALVVEGRAATCAWLSWAVLSASFCYTNNVGVFSVAAQCVFVTSYVGWSWIAGRRSAATSALRKSAHDSSDDRVSDSDGFRASAWRGLMALSLFVALYGLPWGSRLWSQSTTVRTTTSIIKPLRADDIPVEIHRAVVSSWATKPSGRRTTAWLTIAVLGVLFGWIGSQRGWSYRYLLMTGVIPLVLIIAFSAVSNRSILHARYLTFVQLSWIAAFSVVLFGGRMTPERRFLGAIVMVNCVCVLVFNWSDVGPTHQPGLRGAMAYAVENMGPGELLIARERHVFFGMNYYATQQNRSTLLLADTHDPVSLRGGEAMTRSDLITPAALVAREPQGVWIFTTTAYSDPQRAAFAVPADWTLVDQKEFAQDYYWESFVSVRHYRPRDSVGSIRKVSFREGK